MTLSLFDACGAMAIRGRRDLRVSCIKVRGGTPGITHGEGVVRVLFSVAVVAMALTLLVG